MAVNFDLYITNAESTKAMVLDQMVSDNMIPAEQATKFAEEWQFILVKRKWYKQWWAKMLKQDPSIQDKDGNEYEFKLVKF